MCVIFYLLYESKKCVNDNTLCIKNSQPLIIFQLNDEPGVFDTHKCITPIKFV